MHKNIQTGLRKLGFNKLTKPQEEAIPLVQAGKSVLVVAPTGYGKTEAALLPLFEWILENKPNPVSVLYITPLKALNRDLLDRMKFWNEWLKINISVRHGDTSQTERRKQMMNPPDILITTPETFQGMLTAAQKLLVNVKWVIVDEIHELLDNKRGYQLAVGLERLKSITKFTRIGLSATVRDTKLAADFLAGSDSFPKLVEINELKKIQLKVDSPEPTSADLSMAKQNLLDPGVAARLSEISKLEGSILVFTNTREMAELLGSRLNLLVPTHVHHSSLSKATRIKGEQEFKSGKVRALVATSSMELGIDIGLVEWVVQYMSPRQALRLTQRVGRSGHSWKRTAKGLVLATDPQDILESAVIAKATTEGRLESSDIEASPLDVLSHQIVGTILQKKTRDEAYEIIKGSQPFRTLSRTDFDRVVRFMQDIRLIGQGLRGGSMPYYYSNLSTIPDSRDFAAVNMVDGHRFATLDEEFVSSLETGMVFICAGKFWQLVDIDPVNSRVLVEPAKEAHSAPAWEGELIPVTKEIAGEVVELKSKLWKMDEGDAIDYLTKNYPITGGAARKALKWVKGMSWTEPAIEIFKNFAFIHIPLGSKANEALGKLLAGFFSLRTGASVGMRSDHYRIMLEFPSATDGEFIRKVLNSISPKHIEANLCTLLRHSPLYRHRFVQVARRFGVISRGAELSKFSLNKLVESFQSTPLEEETLKEIFAEKIDFQILADSINQLKDLPVYIGPSPMSRYMLEHYAPELIGVRPEAEVLNALKTRLEKKRFNLRCLYCKKWEGSGTPLTAPSKCPNCGAKLIGVFYERENKKAVNLSANLFLSYGRKALLTMAGRGVGPETASRILSRAGNETELLKLILKAEKLYARTKRFWKT